MVLASVKDHLRRRGPGNLATHILRYNDMLVPAGYNGAAGADVMYRGMMGGRMTQPGAETVAQANMVIDGLTERERIANEHPHGGLVLSSHGPKPILMSQQELADRGMSYNWTPYVRPANDTVARDRHYRKFYGGRQ